MATEQAPDRRSGGTEGEGPVDQPSLPFDAAADEPISYALTARARRTVAPSSLPELSVVPEPEVDPFDPRRPRARALRRAGRSPSDIAELLDVSEEVVRNWVGSVGPRADRRREREGRQGPGQVRRLPLPEPDRSAARERGCEEAAAVLRDADSPAATAIAWLAGRVSISPHAATLRVDDADLAARIAACLEDLTGLDRSRVRLVLEVGGDVAHDLVQGRWAEATGVPTEHIAVSRSASADAIRGTFRVADPEIAAVLAGWQDAVVEVLGGELAGDRRA